MRKLGIIVLLVGLVGCAHKEPLTAELYKGQDAAQIFKKGETALVKADYPEAIRHFEALDALYPFSEFEEQAQRDIIYAYYKSPDYASAGAAAVRYIHLYPRSKHVDYAYYMKGMSNFNQDRGLIQRYVDVDLSKRDPGMSKQAFADFSELIRRFPESPYAPDARNRMVYLRNLLAQQELNAAEFYFQQGSYVAAINRVNYILSSYQRAPQVIPGLGIMVRSYQALGLNRLADQTMSILALNFPDSEVYQKLVKGK